MFYKMKLLCWVVLMIFVIRGGTTNTQTLSLSQSASMTSQTISSSISLPTATDTVTLSLPTSSGSLSLPTGTSTETVSVSLPTTSNSQSVTTTITLSIPTASESESNSLTDSLSLPTATESVSLSLPTGSKSFSSSVSWSLPTGTVSMTLPTLTVSFSLTPVTATKSLSIRTITTSFTFSTTKVTPSLTLTFSLPTATASPSHSLSETFSETKTDEGYYYYSAVAYSSSSPSLVDFPSVVAFQEGVHVRVRIRLLGSRVERFQDAYFNISRGSAAIKVVELDAGCNASAATSSGVSLYVDHLQGRLYNESATTAERISDTNVLHDTVYTTIPMPVLPLSEENRLYAICFRPCEACQFELGNVSTIYNITRSPVSWQVNSPGLNNTYEGGNIQLKISLDDVVWNDWNQSTPTTYLSNDPIVGDRLKLVPFGKTCVSDRIHNRIHDNIASSGEHSSGLTSDINGPVTLHKPTQFSTQNNTYAWIVLPSVGVYSVCMDLLSDRSPDYYYSRYPVWRFIKHHHGGGDGGDNITSLYTPLETVPSKYSRIKITSEPGSYIQIPISINTNLWPRMVLRDGDFFHGIGIRIAIGSPNCFYPVISSLYFSTGLLSTSGTTGQSRLFIPNEYTTFTLCLQDDISQVITQQWHSVGFINVVDNLFMNTSFSLSDYRAETLALVTLRKDSSIDILSIKLVSAGHPSGCYDGGVEEVVSNNFRGTPQTVFFDLLLPRYSHSGYLFCYRISDKINNWYTASNYFTNDRRLAVTASPQIRLQWSDKRVGTWSVVEVISSGNILTTDDKFYIVPVNSSVHCGDTLLATVYDQPFKSLSPDVRDSTGHVTSRNKVYILLQNPGLPFIDDIHGWRVCYKQVGLNPLEIGISTPGEIQSPVGLELVIETYHVSRAALYLGGVVHRMTVVSQAAVLDSRVGRNEMKLTSGKCHNSAIGRSHRTDLDSTETNNGASLTTVYMNVELPQNQSGKVIICFRYHYSNNWYEFPQHVTLTPRNTFTSNTVVNQRYHIDSLLSIKLTSTQHDIDPQRDYVLFIPWKQSCIPSVVETSLIGRSVLSLKSEWPGRRVAFATLYLDKQNVNITSQVNKKLRICLMVYGMKSLIDVSIHPLSDDVVIVESLIKNIIIPTVYDVSLSGGSILSSPPQVRFVVSTKIDNVFIGSNKGDVAMMIPHTSICLYYNDASFATLAISPSGVRSNFITGTMPTDMGLYKLCLYSFSMGTWFMPLQPLTLREPDVVFTSQMSNFSRISLNSYSADFSISQIYWILSGGDCLGNTRMGTYSLLVSNVTKYEAELQSGLELASGEYKLCVKGRIKLSSVDTAQVAVHLPTYSKYVRIEVPFSEVFLSIDNIPTYQITVPETTIGETISVAVSARDKVTGTVIRSLGDSVHIISSSPALKLITTSDTRLSEGRVLLKISVLSKCSQCTLTLSCGVGIQSQQLTIRTESEANHLQIAPLNVIRASVSVFPPMVSMGQVSNTAIVYFGEVIPVLVYASPTVEINWGSVLANNSKDPAVGLGCNPGPCYSLRNHVTQNKLTFSLSLDDTSHNSYMDSTVDAVVETGIIQGLSYAFRVSCRKPHRLDAGKGHFFLVPNIRSLIQNITLRDANGILIRHCKSAFAKLYCTATSGYAGDVHCEGQLQNGVGELYIWGTKDGVANFHIHTDNIISNTVSATIQSFTNRHIVVSQTNKNYTGRSFISERLDFSISLMTQSGTSALSEGELRVFLIPDNPAVAVGKSSIISVLNNVNNSHTFQNGEVNISIAIMQRCDGCNLLFVALTAEESVRSRLPLSIVADPTQQFVFKWFPAMPVIGVGQSLVFTAVVESSLEIITSHINDITATLTLVSPSNVNKIVVVSRIRTSRVLFNVSIPEASEWICKQDPCNIEANITTKFGDVVSPLQSIVVLSHSPIVNNFILVQNSDNLRYSRATDTFTANANEEVYLIIHGVDQNGNLVGNSLTPISMQLLSQTSANIIELLGVGIGSNSLLPSHRTLVKGITRFDFILSRGCGTSGSPEQPCRILFSNNITNTSLEIKILAHGTPVGIFPIPKLPTTFMQSEHHIPLLLFTTYNSLIPFPDVKYEINITDSTRSFDMSVGKELIETSDSGIRIQKTKSHCIIYSELPRVLSVTISYLKLLLTFDVTWDNRPSGVSFKILNNIPVNASSRWIVRHPESRFLLLQPSSVDFIFSDLSQTSSIPIGSSFPLMFRVLDSSGDVASSSNQFVFIKILSGNDPASPEYEMLVNSVNLRSPINFKGELSVNITFTRHCTKCKVVVIYFGDEIGISLNDRVQVLGVFNIGTNQETINEHIALSGWNAIPSIMAAGQYYNVSLHSVFISGNAVLRLSSISSQVIVNGVSLSPTPHISISADFYVSGSVLFFKFTSSCINCTVTLLHSRSDQFQVQSPPIEIFNANNRFFSVSDPASRIVISRESPMWGHPGEVFCFKIQAVTFGGSPDMFFKERIVIYHPSVIDFWEATDFTGGVAYLFIKLVRVCRVNCVIKVRASGLPREGIDLNDYFIPKPELVVISQVQFPQQEIFCIVGNPLLLNMSFYDSWNDEVEFEHLLITHHSIDISHFDITSYGSCDVSSELTGQGIVVVSQQNCFVKIRFIISISVRNATGDRAVSHKINTNYVSVYFKLESAVLSDISLENTTTGNSITNDSTLTFISSEQLFINISSWHHSDLLNLERGVSLFKTVQFDPEYRIIFANSNGIQTDYYGNAVIVIGPNSYTGERITVTRSGASQMFINLRRTIQEVKSIVVRQPKYRLRQYWFPLSLTPAGYPLLVINVTHFFDQQTGFVFVKELPVSNFVSTLSGVTLAIEGSNPESVVFSKFVLRDSPNERLYGGYARRYVHDDPNLIVAVTGKTYSIGVDVELKEGNVISANDLGLRICLELVSEMYCSESPNFGVIQNVQFPYTDTASVGTILFAASNSIEILNDETSKIMFESIVNPEAIALEVYEEFTKSVIPITIQQSNKYLLNWVINEEIIIKINSIDVNYQKVVSSWKGSSSSLYLNNSEITVGGSEPIHKTDFTVKMDPAAEFTVRVSQPGMYQYVVPTFPFFSKTTIIVLYASQPRELVYLGPTEINFNSSYTNIPFQVIDEGGNPVTTLPQQSYINITHWSTPHVESLLFAFNVVNVSEDVTSEFLVSFKVIGIPILPPHECTLHAALYYSRGGSVVVSGVEILTVLYNDTDNISPVISESESSPIKVTVTGSISSFNKLYFQKTVSAAVGLRQQTIVIKRVCSPLGDCVAPQQSDSSRRQVIVSTTDNTDVVFTIVLSPKFDSVPGEIFSRTLSSVVELLTSTFASCISEGICSEGLASLGPSSFVSSDSGPFTITSTVVFNPTGQTESPHPNKLTVTVTESIHYYEIQQESSADYLQQSVVVFVVLLALL